MEKLEIVCGNEPGPQDKLYFRKNEDGLALCRNELSLKGDLSEKAGRLKHHNLTHELLVKSAKIKDASGLLTAVDATAGLGEDALLLAACGFQVHLFERNEVVAALLEDALKRAGEAEDLILREAALRMILHKEDSVQAMKALPFTPDVVYLDPMFPERKKSGSIKKKFQLLQLLERPCGDEEDLMEAALASHPKKIIVKRPAHAETLAGVKPSYQLAGNSIRYDVILPG